MPTRRDVIKGTGGALFSGLAVTSPRAHVLASTTTSSSPSTSTPATGATPAALPAFRPVSSAPLYWSTYGYENTNNKIIPESVWKSNVDWVAANFRDYGYKMVCTDGWIDQTQKVTSHGYILSQATTGSTTGPGGQSISRPRASTRRVLQPAVGDPLGGARTPRSPSSGGPTSRWPTSSTRTTTSTRGGLCSGWTSPATEPRSTSRGTSTYFRQLGAVLLRIDFLAWYEAGFDQSEGTVGVAHGRETRTCVRCSGCVKPRVTPCS